MNRPESGTLAAAYAYRRARQTSIESPCRAYIPPAGTRGRRMLACSPLKAGEPGAGTSAATALSLARADVASYTAALAAGDTATAAKFRRYAPDVSPSGRPWAAVTWQPGKPGLAHVTRPDSSGLRHVGDVEPESGRFSRHDGLGWYTDPFGDVFRDGTGLCWGTVYQLPGRDGKARFVAGYVYGGTDGGPTLDLGHVFEEPRGDWYNSVADCDAARDAARAADSMAQRAAETERDYQRAWQAGSQWAGRLEEIRNAGAELRTLRAERSRVRKLGTAAAFPAICKALAAQIAAGRARIAELRGEMDSLAAGDGGPFDELAFYPDADAKQAFCEGAGLGAYPAR